MKKDDPVSVRLFHDKNHVALHKMRSAQVDENHLGNYEKIYQYVM